MTINNPFVTTTPATGYGTCEGCHTTCTQVALTTVTMAAHGGSKYAQQYLCTKRCVGVFAVEAAPLFDLTEVAHVTASVVTANSTYVVVARPRYGVRVVCPSGEVLEGTHLHMVGDRLFLRDNDTDRTLLRTSTVVAVHVHEN